MRKNNQKLNFLFFGKLITSFFFYTIFYFYTILLYTRTINIIIGDIILIKEYRYKGTDGILLIDEDITTDVFLSLEEIDKIVVFYYDIKAKNLNNKLTILGERVIICQML